MVSGGLGGPEVGRVLDGLLEAVRNGDLPNEREALLCRLNAPS